MATFKSHNGLTGKCCRTSGTSASLAVRGNFKTKTAMKYLISVLIFISWILPIFSQVKSDTAINLTNPIHDNSIELMWSVKKLYASDTANNKIFLHYFKGVAPKS